MTEKNEKNNDQLDSLLSKASGEEWIPLPGFESRVIARLDREMNQSPIGILAWKLMPFTVVVSIVVSVLALMTESFDSMLFTVLSDPFSVGNLVSLL